ncbi:hypothetical protein [Komagataeibacter xylinus]|uniref:Uncharacterized protein n=1 Tax=Komagataeibacter xylinus TaxID=28448 RepID=A0A857FKM0_KOMXY|nr:hypothetical protein [Komagataeibacter xylinus]QHC34735.1 hypothetical protein FMA36_03710 [Komagataeibacter xylinus]
MKDEIKNKLDALFVDDTNRKIKSEQKRNIEAEQQAAFIEQFRAKTDEVIAPAFEDFILYLRPNGWNGSVQRKSETPTGNNYGRGVTSTSSSLERVSLAFTHASRNIKGIHNTNEPHFTVICEKAKRLVTFHEATPSQAGGAGSAKLDDITADYLHEKLVTYFKKLMHDARPYDER